MTTEERLEKVERELAANKIMQWWRRKGGGAMKQMVFPLAIGMFVLALGVCAARAAEGQDPANELRLLRAENTLLKASLAQRNKEVEALKAEIAKLSEQVRQLQELCRNAGIALPQPTAEPVATPPEAPKAETYMYLGKPCPKMWFEQMYRKFADKIVRVDGKYLDVGKAVAGYTDDQPYVGDIGTAGVIPIGCTIMQVIDNDEVLILKPGWSREVLIVPDEIFHVTGVDTKGLVDGSPFQAKIVCIGTYHYVTVTGAGATITSCAVHTPLTKEQFAEALAGGLQLVSYRRVEVQKPGGEREFKTVGTPVLSP
jgi:cell division protein FtsB